MRKNRNLGSLVAGLGSLVFVSLMLVTGCEQGTNPVRPLTGDVLHQLADLPPTPSGIVHSVDLMAGQIHYAGQVKLTCDGTTLWVQCSTNDDWTMSETHVAVAETLDGIPVTRSGNPKLGHFPYKFELTPPGDDHTFAIDLDAAGLGQATNIVVAAHATVFAPDEYLQCVAIESAWAEGERFPFLKPGKPNRGSWAMYFTVDLLQLQGLVLWSKLGSNQQVLDSAYGPDGGITGDLGYHPAMFDDGFRSMWRTGDHDIPDNFIDYENLQLGQKGCIEFWYQPDWINPSVGHIVVPITYGPVGNHGSYIMVWEYNDWQDLLNLNLRDPVAASGDVAAVAFRPSQCPEWSMSQPFHVGIMWDGTDPVPTQRLRLFLNGIDVTTIGGWAYTYGDPTFDGFPADATLRLGSRLGPGDWYRHRWEDSGGITDNLKVWSYSKVDFSGRFEE